MTSKEIIEDYIEILKTNISEDGELAVDFSVFARKKGDSKEKLSVINIPIPGIMMNSSYGKDFLVDKFLPDVMQKVKEEFNPYGLVWASEAWMRVTDKNFDPDKDNYEDIPNKKEVLMIHVETETESDLHIYEIKRLGKQVNSKGNLTDKIELEELPDMKGAERVSGRLTGLFKKLKL